jgi:tripartite-type tricarboxylate transporter receptor subunit TctC
MISDWEDVGHASFERADRAHNERGGIMENDDTPFLHWRRRRSIATVLAAAVAWHASVCSAQTYPSKPVRIIVPFSAGGGSDLVARAISPKLTAALGQSVIIDNRPGADGQIGASQVAKAPPDGYTLLVGTTGPMVINPALEAKTPYDTLRDFAPITQLITQPIALVVHPSLPVATVSQFVAFAKTRPGQLSYGTAGTGSGTHLGAEIFAGLTGIKMLHVPYKGTAPAVTDVMSGQVQAIFSSIPVLLPHIQSHRLKALAVGSEARMPMLPGVPTMSEAGVTGFDASSWYGLFAPAGTSADVLRRLNTETASALKSPEIDKLLSSQGAFPVGSSVEQFSAHIRTELVKWKRAVEAAGVKGQ